MRATRESHGRLPEIAIVALSSDDSDSVVGQMLEAGASARVRKGASSQELDRVLRMAIEARRGS